MNPPRKPSPAQGSLVLDSQGLALAIGRDAALAPWLALAVRDDLRVMTSAATLVEVPAMSSYTQGMPGYDELCAGFQLRQRHQPTTVVAARTVEDMAAAVVAVIRTAAR